MEDSNKFTPGPWEFRNVAGAGLGIYGDVSATMGKDFSELVQIFGLGHVSEPKFQIAYERWVQFPKRDWDEMQQANARLIAASPEMLQMLRYCHQWLQGTEPHRARAVGEVIAKATGA